MCEQVFATRNPIATAKLWHGHVTPTICNMWQSFLQRKHKGQKAMGATVADESASNNQFSVIINKLYMDKEHDIIYK